MLWLLGSSAYSRRHVHPPKLYDLTQGHFIPNAKKILTDSLLSLLAASARSRRHGQLRQVVEATACNSSKVLLDFVVNGRDAMADVEAVWRRLLVGTELANAKNYAYP